MRFSHSSRLLPISSSAKPSISFQRLEKNTVPSATFQSHSPSPAPSRANFQRYSLSCRAACAFLRSVTSINVARTSSSRDEPPIMTMRSAPLLQVTLYSADEHTSELQSPKELVCRLLLEN